MRRQTPAPVQIAKNGNILSARAGVAWLRAS
jgi:hypothetical protein